MKKRAFERIPANLEAKFSYGNEFNTGTISDMSKNGMFIKSNICVPLKSKIDILIQVGEEVLKLPVEVSRLLKAGDIYNGMGVKLLNPPKQYLEFLGTLKWNQIKDLKTEKRKGKIFICRVCQHIEFDHAPMNCPFCTASIEDFAEDSRAINTLENFEYLGVFEKKHFPIITVSKEYSSARYLRYIDVHVKIGEIEHCMEVNDRITFMDFYFNEFNLNKRCIARVNLNCTKMNPESALRLNNVTSGILTVINNCNAHGNWMAEIEL